MKLLIQPDDSSTPVLDAITQAEKSIDMYIFRLAYPRIERALGEAVKRGVVVRTLIAHTNTGGEEALRELELRLLGLGATVSRTDEHLLRYHGKMMIVDRATLYVLGYNFTRRDIDRSRSLGIAAQQRALVAEALRLFEADFHRQPYAAGMSNFVVSPANSRAALVRLIEDARERLLIYDSRLTDNAVQRVIEGKATDGVEVKVIGKVEKKLKNVEVRRYGGGCLHVRAIVQDARRAFVGSQSLRRAELERRREIGVIVTDSQIVDRMVKTFQSDWAHD